MFDVTFDWGIKGEVNVMHVHFYYSVQFFMGELAL